MPSPTLDTTVLALESNPQAPVLLSAALAPALADLLTKKKGWHVLAYHYATEPTQDRRDALLVEVHQCVMTQYAKDDQDFVRRLLSILERPLNATDSDSVVETLIKEMVGRYVALFLDPWCKQSTPVTSAGPLFLTTALQGAPHVFKAWCTLCPPPQEWLSAAYTIPLHRGRSLRLPLIHAAVHASNPDLVAFLCGHGADPTLKDERGWPAWAWLPDGGNALAPPLSVWRKLLGEPSLSQRDCVYEAHEIRTHPQSKLNIPYSKGPDQADPTWHAFTQAYSPSTTYTTETQEETYKSCLLETFGDHRSGGFLSFRNTPLLQAFESLVPEVNIFAIRHGKKEMHLKGEAWKKAAEQWWQSLTTPDVLCTTRGAPRGTWSSAGVVCWLMWTSAVLIHQGPPRYSGLTLNAPSFAGNACPENLRALWDFCKSQPGWDARLAETHFGALTGKQFAQGVEALLTPSLTTYPAFHTLALAQVPALRAEQRSFFVTHLQSVWNHLLTQPLSKIDLRWISDWIASPLSEVWKGTQTVRFQSDTTPDHNKAVVTHLLFNTFDWWETTLKKPLPEILSEDHVLAVRGVVASVLHWKTLCPPVMVSPPKTRTYHSMHSTQAVRIANLLHVLWEQSTTHPDLACLLRTAPASIERNSRAILSATLPSTAFSDTHPGFPGADLLTHWEELWKKKEEAARLHCALPPRQEEGSTAPVSRRRI